MSPANAQTLINLLMLLALLAGIAIWWTTKHGSVRGRVAARAHEATVAHRMDSAVLEDDVEARGFRQRLSRRLATLGDRIPLFDAKYRAKLQKTMVSSGYRSNV